MYPTPRKRHARFYGQEFPKANVRYAGPRQRVPRLPRHCRTARRCVTEGAPPDRRAGARHPPACPGCSARPWLYASLSPTVPLARSICAYKLRSSRPLPLRQYGGVHSPLGRTQASLGSTGSYPGGYLESLDKLAGWRRGLSRTAAGSAYCSSYRRVTE
eukprot:1195220-Prorocentrum_minimum.AAC.1